MAERRLKSSRTCGAALRTWLAFRPDYTESKEEFGYRTGRSRPGNPHLPAFAFELAVTSIVTLELFVPPSPVAVNVTV